MGAVIAAWQSDTIVTDIGLRSVGGGGGWGGGADSALCICKLQLMARRRRCVTETSLFPVVYVSRIAISLLHELALIMTLK